jgi:N4-gp56 family major capsid protein
MPGQLWGTNVLGGYMYSLNLSKVLRHAVQPMIKWRQFADVKDATQQGKKKGDTFNWNVYSDVKTQGGELLETDLMPETNFDIRQGALTITERGNSVPFTSKLDDLSEHPVKEVINKVLKHDAKKSFDLATYDQFNSTPLVITPTGGADPAALTLDTTGTPVDVNNIALGKDHIKSVSDLMKERDIPTYGSSGDYYAIAHPSTFRSFKNELETIHQYTNPGFSKIMNGEIGRYEGMRFIEQTNIPKETWANGLSNFCFFFGDDTVAEAIAIPEEMRGKIPTDYGRSKGIAWLYLGGFGIVHLDPDQARIFKWATA